MRRGARNRQWALYGLAVLGMAALAISVIENLAGPSISGTVYAVEQASPAEGEKASAPAASAPTAQAAEGETTPSQKEEAQTPATAQLIRERDLFTTLRARELALDVREKSLAKETEQLNFLRAGLEQKIQELRNLQTEIQQRLTQAEAQRKKEMKNLLEVYKAMKADSAAKVLGEMEEKTALQILSGLDPQMTSKILSGIAEVNPKKAAEMTQRLMAVPGL